MNLRESGLTIGCKVHVNGTERVDLVRELRGLVPNGGTQWDSVRAGEDLLRTKAAIGVERVAW